MQDGGWAGRDAFVIAPAIGFVNRIVFDGFMFGFPSRLGKKKWPR
jgi:hypothetical protein